MQNFTRIKNSQPMGPKVLADAQKFGRLGVRSLTDKKSQEKIIKEET